MGYEIDHWIDYNGVGVLINQRGTYPAQIDSIIPRGVKFTSTIFLLIDYNIKYAFFYNIYLQFNLNWAMTE